MCWFSVRGRWDLILLIRFSISLKVIGRDDVGLCDAGRFGDFWGVSKWGLCVLYLLSDCQDLRKPNLGIKDTNQWRNII